MTVKELCIFVMMPSFVIGFVAGIIVNHFQSSKKAVASFVENTKYHIEPPPNMVKRKAKFYRLSNARKRERFHLEHLRKAKVGLAGLEAIRAVEGE